MSGRIPSRGSDQFNLRFPDGMREELKILAAQNGRSLNAEIIQRLERTLTSDVLNKVIPDNVIDKQNIQDEHDKEILRKKLEEALIGTGITEVLAEYVFKERNKGPND